MLSTCILRGRTPVGFFSICKMFSNVAGSAEPVSTKLLGKSAIITAATEGIGFAIAKRLVLDGASVVVSSRQKKHVEETVKRIATLSQQAGSQGQVRGVLTHVSKPEDRAALIKEAVTHFGKLDIVVSNAGVSPAFGPLVKTSESIWDKIFEINVKDAFLLVKEAVPKLSTNGDGSVIFISSIAGFQPFKHIGAYSVSKAALLSLTKVFASELADCNIRVNSVCPGVVRTKFSQPLYETPEINKSLIGQTPMKRIAEPDEIAGLVSFLCSKDAAFITGENMVVAGGMFSRL